MIVFFCAVLAFFAILFYVFGGAPCVIIWCTFWFITLGVLLLLNSAAP